MKEVARFANGVIVLKKDNGKFILAVSEDASLGGGEAAGIIKVKGSAEVELNAEQALKLAEALLNAHLPPALVPLAQVVEGIVNQAVLAIGE